VLERTRLREGVIRMRTQLAVWALRHWALSRARLCMRAWREYTARVQADRANAAVRAIAPLRSGWQQPLPQRPRRLLQPVGRGTSETTSPLAARHPPSQLPPTPSLPLLVLRQGSSARDSPRHVAARNQRSSAALSSARGSPRHVAARRRPRQRRRQRRHRRR
jgi:hypothetical protein